MISKLLLFTLSQALLSIASPAARVENNPTDVVLRADFPSGNSQTVVGVIQFYSLNGLTKVHVDITGLPKNSGIFSYHIHDKPLEQPSSRCEETGGHFNPFNSQGDCDSFGDDSLCEVGDLSGKHGLINTTCFETFYYDPYLSLDPAHPQYIGNKAINIHLADHNNERLACANIKPSKEPEDLLLLNEETERQEVKKYEDLSGVKIEEFDYGDYDSDLLVYTNSLEIENGTTDDDEIIQEEIEEVILEGDDNEVIEEVPESESTEEVEGTDETDDETVTDEALDFGQNDDDLEELVQKDVVGDDTFIVGGNYSYNVTNTSGEEDDRENSGDILHYQAIFGFFCAISVALLI